MGRIVYRTAAAALGAAAFVVTALPVSAHGYGSYRYRDRGIDAGDVVAGVVVLGTIAAIANSAKNRDRYERRYPSRERYPEDARYRGRYEERDYRSDYRPNYRDADGARGMERAVDMCIDEIEQDRDRVDTVDHAARNAQGWKVAGTMRSGSGFSCEIDNDGRLREIDLSDVRYDDREPSARSYREDHDYVPAVAGVGHDSDTYGVGSAGGPQMSDAEYARARSGQRYASPPVAYEQRDLKPEADEPRPAYPGGPLPGEGEPLYGDYATPESGDGYNADDGRYTTAQAPDFKQT